MWASSIPLSLSLSPYQTKGLLQQPSSDYATSATCEWRLKLSVPTLGYMLLYDVCGFWFEYVAIQVQVHFSYVSEKSAKWNRDPVVWSMVKHFSVIPNCECIECGIPLIHREQALSKSQSTSCWPCSYPTLRTLRPVLWSPADCNINSRTRTVRPVAVENVCSILKVYSVQ